MRSLLISLSIALIAITQASSPALARPENVDPVRIVRYGDLDLTHIDGQSTLKRRTDAAIRDVCPEPDERDLGMLAQRQHCLASARTSAHEKVAAAISASVRLADRAASNIQVANR